jgi:hypothetical protein
MKNFGRKSLIVLSACLLILGSAFQSDAGRETCYGKTIPEFRGVFIKLFRIMMNEMSMDQLKTTSAQLSESERAAISYFLGEDGHAKVRAGLPPEKQAFLDEKYMVHTQVPPDYDFQKVFPHILCVANSNLTMDQYLRTIKALTDEEIASQSFYMGEEGRAAYFKELSPKQIEALLDRTPEWVLIETGRRKYAKIKDYTSILYKIERLGDEVQAQEKILVKFREKPFSIYMKWIDGPWKGRELVYNEALLGKGKVRVRESGVLGIIPVTLPVESEIAKRGSNHMVTEIGLKYLLELIDKNYRKAVAAKELGRKNHGIADLDGNKAYWTESILPKDPAKGYYCYRMHHYIDFARSLEIKAVVFRWDDKLYEQYYYTQIKLNAGLTDRDFDPTNPDYSLE